MENLILMRHRVKSALIGVIAGAVWMFWSTAFVGTAVIIWGPMVTVLTILVLIWSISRIRYIRHRTVSSDDSQSSNLFGRVYWVIVVLEFLLAGGIVFFLLTTRRSELIPVAVAFIVGLHFLPLAKLFRMPTLYITGTTMVIIAVASLSISDANIRNLSICLGIGIILWLRTFMAIRQIVSSLKTMSAP
jgi:hypothetical protein